MIMAGNGEEELKMSVKLGVPPNESSEVNRSRQVDVIAGAGIVAPCIESLEDGDLRLRRELMAAAAEKRMAADKTVVENVESGNDAEAMSVGVENEGKGVILKELEGNDGSPGTLLSMMESNKLFSMIFGDSVSKNVLAQWTNQGVRLSEDIETCMGLVQREGGPCGVLAAIQAFLLKYLLFDPEESYNALSMDTNSTCMRTSDNGSEAEDILYNLSEEKISRALVWGMTEILFLCGRNEKVVIASLDILCGDSMEPKDKSTEDVIAKVLDGLSIESGSDLQKVLRVSTCYSPSSIFQKLESMLPLFRSRLGVLLFLISALMSRGLDNVQEDRDDPNLPLVTAPFGHASQEIVNLLLSGSAVADVFDGNIDLGDGMFIKGVSTAVEVGFLTLLESLHLCKVGQNLKCPRWPIWVVGSESHYTVLFALDNKVQEENDVENRETLIRRAFDAQDQSGGGGFVSVEGFHQVIRETNISLPREKLNHLCSAGFIVWSDFEQVLLDVDYNSGGLDDKSGSKGKVFDLYHFNGIAKSVGNGGQTSSGSVNVTQQPRLSRLRVSVPPKWTPEEFWANAPAAASSSTASGGAEISKELSDPRPVQYAPLVDCVRTRWQRAVCSWDGDAPSIV